jgi:hypothetical protein
VRQHGHATLPANRGEWSEIMRRRDFVQCATAMTKRTLTVTTDKSLRKRLERQLEKNR